MAKDLLFPHYLRRVGYLLFPFSIAYALLSAYASFLPAFLSTMFENEGFVNSGYDEICTVGAVVGLMLIAFSREEVEDEMTRLNRLQSLQWSVYASYILLLLSVVFVYDTYFMVVLEVNLFTVLCVFIIRFRWQAAKWRRDMEMSV